VIELHQFARVWDIPNLSPFCCKVETVLRMAGISYKVADAVPPTAPRGKLPYITDGARTVYDSRLILEYLRTEYGVDLDAGLTAEQRAQSLAFQRMIEDDLHWAAVVWPRWHQAQNWAANKRAIFGCIPPGLRDAVALWARARMRKQIRGQGLGRNSEDEIFELTAPDLTALSDFLGDKPFFMGDTSTTLDASAFGLLTNLVWVPIESPLKTHAAGLANLIGFCERMRDRYFPPG
jgi:glutathione S-transferase